MFKGRFLGMAWNVEDAMYYRIISYRHKREEIINRSVCVPRDPDCDVPPPLSGVEIPNMFPKLMVEQPKTSPPAISGGDARLNNEPAKRLKANARDDASRGIIDSMSPETAKDDQGTSIMGCKDDYESATTQETTDETWDPQADDESIGTTTNNEALDQQGETAEVETDFNKLHKEEVQEMLNSSDEAFDQYEILGHSWSRSNLRLKILEKRTGAELTVDAADAKVDCPHQLASYIMDKKVGGKHSGHWKEWAKTHFKKMRRVF